MLFYMFGSVKCSFRAFLSRMEYQASRISLCRHADNLSTFQPTESFHLVLLRHLCVLSRVFLVRAMFIRLAAIVISTVVISGEGFRYSLSFPRHFVLSGRMFFARSMRVRTTECLYWGWWCDLKTRSVLVAFL